MASSIVRLIWFVFIGWWLGLLWFTGSVVLMGSIIFFPFGAYLATKTWTVMTLKESPREVVVEAESRQEQEQRQVAESESAGDAPGRICPECGMENPREANYCGDCGYSFGG